MRTSAGYPHTSTIYWGLLFVIVPMAAFVLGSLYGVSPIAQEPSVSTQPALEAPIPFERIGSDGIITLMPDIETLPDQSATPASEAAGTPVNTPFALGIVAFAVALLLALAVLSAKYVSGYLDFAMRRGLHESVGDDLVFMKDDGSMAQVVTLHELRHLRARKRESMEHGVRYTHHEHDGHDSADRISKTERRRIAL